MKGYLGNAEEETGSKTPGSETPARGEAEAACKVQLARDGLFYPEDKPTGSTILKRTASFGETVIASG